MSWELVRPEDASDPRPGMEQFDDYIRKNVIMTRLEDMLAWSRKNSLWPFNFGLSCCYVEAATAISSRHDIARFRSRSIPCHSSTGRHDHYCRNRFPQDGASCTTSL